MRRFNQTHCFSLGRSAGLASKTIQDNPFDDEKEVQQYLWWHEGWEFGQVELEESDDD